MLKAVFGWVRRAAHVMLFLTVLCVSLPALAVLQTPGTTITLGWDPSTDPSVVGYHLYYGVASGTYTNMIDAGTNTSVTVSNLVPGVTYYFAVTTYTAAGVESMPSSEITYTVPVPNPPTLNSINNVSINENSGPQTVSLAGISAGAGNPSSNLVVSAFSSVTALIPNPVVTYSAPNATGSLTFAPVTNAFGSAQITVMVDNGLSYSNTVIRTFNVNVAQVVTQTPVTNAVVLPNTAFRWQINPPFTNGDKLTFSLDPGAPTGAGIIKWHGNSLLSWVPSSAQAQTTNVISVRITDTTTPSLSTNRLVQVIVLDYANVSTGPLALQAGQNGSLPIYLSASDLVSNFSFTVSWPSNRFINPTLSNVASGIAASTVQNQSSNLLITVRAASGSALQGSNPVLQLNFQTVSSQSSAFVYLPTSLLSAQTPSSRVFVNCTATSGRVVVVKDQPLLEALLATNGSRTLGLYGRVGTNYQLQYKSSLASGSSWSPVLTYMHTNVAQTFSVSSASPVIMYRLQQQ
jgi:hypothetical protein